MENLNHVSVWSMGPFKRPEGVNPVVSPNPDSTFQCPMRQKTVKWEALHTFNPTAVVKENKVFLLYRAEDDSGIMQIGHHTSRLGLAESSDGIHFIKHPAPVLYPTTDNQKKNEWDGGCEDPRIVETEEGEFVLMYTQYNHKIPRLAVAKSKDLFHWDKYGPVFPKFPLPWLNIFTKSAAILCKVMDGRLKAVKIQEKYLMYWGERSLNLAFSNDLIHWKPGPAVIRPRPGFFDSQLTEGGPPAVLTEKGIVVIYNGKNHATHGDPNLSPDLYAGGQILIDPNNPTRVLSRIDHPFFKPEMPFEKIGQYAAGTTFLEGLVYFHEKWFLYYGCADSYVGVAVWEPNHSNGT